MQLVYTLIRMQIRDRTVSGYIYPLPSNLSQFCVWCVTHAARHWLLLSIGENIDTVEGVDTTPESLELEDGDIIEVFITQIGGWT
jgi:hypothetical protein